MAMVEVDIPKKSQRMLARHASEPNFHSDVDEPIFIQPIKEKPCFALSILMPKSPEERRQIQIKHLNERCTRASCNKIFSENSDSLKKEKEMLKDSPQSTIMHLRENLRKLRYDQSLIHQWGVYTTEPIKKNEAIIEYIGEIIRLRVADKRQVQYEAEGNNGSYIFQLEKDKLIDATHKGGLARFINHSCTPNCATQVKRFDGQNHIIIYAKRDIHPYEELCYDYQMEYEPKEKRIRCLCGSPNCKKWLNWSEKAELELNYKWNNGAEHKRRFQSAPDDHEVESNESSEISETNGLNESNESNQMDQPAIPDEKPLLNEKESLEEFNELDDGYNSDEKDEQDEFDINDFKRQQKRKGPRKLNKGNKSNKISRSNSQNDDYTQVYNRKSISSKSYTRHVIQKEQIIINQPILPVPVKEEPPISVKQEFPIPVNQEPPIHVEQEPPINVKQEFSIPIKQEFSIPIKQEFSIPIKQEFSIPVKQEFPIPVQQEPPIHVKQGPPISVKQEFPIPVKQDHDLIRKISQYHLYPQHINDQRRNTGNVRPPIYSDPNKNFQFSAPSTPFIQHQYPFLQSLAPCQNNQTLPTEIIQNQYVIPLNKVIDIPPNVKRQQKKRKQSPNPNPQINTQNINCSNQLDKNEDETKPIEKTE